MNATSRVHDYLDGGSSRFEAWRDRQLSVPFSVRETEPEPETETERAEARTTSVTPKFPRALPDFARVGKVTRLGGARRR